MLRPVIEALITGEHVEVTVLALTSSRRDLEGLACRIIGYRNFFNNSEVRRLGEKLSGELDNVIDHDESVAYLGQNYLEMSESLGESEAAERYRILGRQSFLPVDSVSAILKVENPDLVVATNSPRSERAALIAAGHLNIISLAIIDLFALRGLEWFCRNDFANRICVLSEPVKSSLVAAGRQEDSIIVTGNPAFDELAIQYNANKILIDKQRRAGNFFVLWASQIEPESCDYTRKTGDPTLPLRVEEALTDIFCKRPDWRLIVRNHPNEPARRYPDFVEVSTQAEAITDLLARVNVVVTLTSTLGLQGAIFGAGFITIDMSVLSDTMPYSSMSMSCGVKSLEQLESTLLQFSQTRRQEPHFSYVTVNATQRVVDQIYDMLGLIRSELK
jgi:hypothetical protein